MSGKAKPPPSFFHNCDRCGQTAPRDPDKMEVHYRRPNCRRRHQARRMSERGWVYLVKKKRVTLPQYEQHVLRTRDRRHVGADEDEVWAPAWMAGVYLAMYSGRPEAFAILLGWLADDEEFRSALETVISLSGLFARNATVFTQIGLGQHYIPVHPAIAINNVKRMVDEWTEKALRDPVKTSQLRLPLATPGGSGGWTSGT